MKMYIKLTQEETAGWYAVKEAITAGQDISDDNLAKLLFFRGLNNIMDELNQKISEMTEEEKAKAMNEYEESKVSKAPAEEKAPKQDLGVLGDELMGSSIVKVPSNIILPQ